MKIYIGNMSYSTTEDQLRQAFEAFGEVSEVNLVMDRDSGRPKGFAFVEMPNQDEGKAAIAAMNGKEFDGRTLNVDEARPRREGAGGGGGGRGGRLSLIHISEPTRQR
ncbi:MAG: RNA-binding protein, partial [candidate division Zixibacteria bacterium]|nr:RNA-binding protein [candidate division Zixibacteria bacterium]